MPLLNPFETPVTALFRCERNVPLIREPTSGDSKNTVLLLETVDRDLLGKAVAQLQSFRPPEPYKGKGVRLMVDGSPTASPVLVKIRQKAGKAGKGGKGGK